MAKIRVYYDKGKNRKKDNAGREICYYYAVISENTFDKDKFLENPASYPEKVWKDWLKNVENICGHSGEYECTKESVLKILEICKNTVDISGAEDSTFDGLECNLAPSISWYMIWGNPEAPGKGSARCMLAAQNSNIMGYICENVDESGICKESGSFSRLRCRLNEENETEILRMIQNQKYAIYNCPDCGKTILISNLQESCPECGGAIQGEAVSSQNEQFDSRRAASGALLRLRTSERKRNPSADVYIVGVPEGGAVPTFKYKPGRTYDVNPFDYDSLHKTLYENNEAERVLQLNAEGKLCFTSEYERYWKAAAAQSAAILPYKESVISELRQSFQTNMQAAFYNFFAKTLKKTGGKWVRRPDGSEHLFCFENAKAYAEAFLKEKDYQKRVELYRLFDDDTCECFLDSAYTAGPSEFSRFIYRNTKEMVYVGVQKIGAREKVTFVDFGKNFRSELATWEWTGSNDTIIYRYRLLENIAKYNNCKVMWDIEDAVGTYLQQANKDGFKEEQAEKKIDSLYNLLCYVQYLINHSKIMQYKGLRIQKEEAEQIKDIRNCIESAYLREAQNPHIIDALGAFWQTKLSEKAVDATVMRKDKKEKLHAVLKKYLEGIGEKQDKEKRQSLLKAYLACRQKGDAHTDIQMYYREKVATPVELAAWLLKECDLKNFREFVLGIESDHEQSGKSKTSDVKIVLNFMLNGSLVDSFQTIDEAEKKSRETFKEVLEGFSEMYTQIYEDANKILLNLEGERQRFLADVAAANRATATPAPMSISVPSAKGAWGGWNPK